MNIRQLETFHWIAELGTFSAAAERLNTSQANVSARIRELESELGVLLFDRIGRQVHLTVKGRELLAHARRVVNEAARLRMAAGKMQVLQGVIRIGMGEVIAAQSLVSIMDEVKSQFSEAEIEFDVDLNLHLARKLERGAIDIAVLGATESLPGVQLTPIGEMRVAWMCAPTLAPELGVMTAREAAELPIMSLPRESRLHALTTAWFAQQGATAQRMSYCNSLSTLLAAARAGVAMCLIPVDIAVDDLEAGRLVMRAPDPEFPPLSFNVATRAGGVDPAVPVLAALVAKAARQPVVPPVIARQGLKVVRG